MADKLYCEETWINQDKGWNCGSSGISETFTDNLGELYRCLQAEYGRCIGKVYIDTDEPHNPKAIGWVFLQRMKYEDVNETFLRETWCTIHTAPPTVTTEYHYAEVK